MSVIIYQEHCEFLEEENKKLKKQVSFLKMELKKHTNIKSLISKNESH